MNDDQVIEGLLYEPGNRIYEDQLYLKYNYFIREGCTRYKLTEDESFSAYSDAVIAVLQNIRRKKFEGRSSLKTYLYQVFNNKCVDHVRHKMADKSATDKAGAFDSWAFSMPDQVQSVVEKMILQFNRDVVNAHINATGEKCTNILLLFEEGLTDKQIAEYLNNQTAAVAKTSRLRKRNLKDLLKPTLKGCYDPLVLSAIRKRLQSLDPVAHKTLVVTPLAENKNIATLQYQY